MPELMPEMFVNLSILVYWSINVAMTLQNRVATHFQASPLISMRTKSLASLQHYRSIDADAWCKRTLRGVIAIW